MAKAFVNATIIPVEGTTIESGTLVIDAGQIKEIGTDIDTTGMDTIDCTGNYITPGLIDAHSHVGLWEEGLTGAFGDGNEMTDPITPHLRAMDAIFPEDKGFDDARKAGVTTLGITPGSGNLIGGQFAVVKAKGSIIDEMLLKEPAGVKFALGENPRGVGKSNNRAPTTRMGNAHLIRKAFYEAIDYRTEWQEYEDARAKEMAKPEEERKTVKQPKSNMTYDVLIKILSGSIPVMNHSHRADDLVTAIRLSEEFGYNLVLHHTTEGHKISEYIARRNIPCVVGPLLTNRSKPELRDRTLITPGVLMDAGVTVALTCDAPVIPIWMLRESMILAVREGLNRERALETITINPAKILGVDDRVGSLKPGKDADFVIWSGDPMNADSYAKSTYVDGELVFEV